MRTAASALFILLTVITGPTRSQPENVAVKVESRARPQFRSGGGNAVVGYLVYGRLDGQLQVSRLTHRNNGLPAGLDLRQLHRPRDAISTPPDARRLYPIFDDSDRRRLKQTCNDIVYETTAARTWRAFPESAVAIGSNGCGDQLIFLAKPGEDRLGDQVFWWDHETGETHRVAADFAELGGGT